MKTPWKYRLIFERITRVVCEVDVSITRAQSLCQPHVHSGKKSKIIIEAVDREEESYFVRQREGEIAEGIECDRH